MSLTRLLGIAALSLPLSAAACVFSASMLMPDPADGQGGAGGSDTASSAAGSSSDAGSGGSGIGTSSSSSGADGMTSSSSGSDGGLTNACANPADEAILVDEVAMTQAARDCSDSCLGTSDYVECCSECVVNKTQISNDCGECWGVFIGCVTDKCAIPCSANPTGPGCTACKGNYCEPAYHACAGV
jgi:hypothetical protein